MLFVSFLCSNFSFLAPSVFIFGGFNDVGGGWFGGIAGVLEKFRDECLELAIRFQVRRFVYPSNP